MRHKVTLCVHDLIFYFDSDLNINTLISEEGAHNDQFYYKDLVGQRKKFRARLLM